MSRLEFMSAVLRRRHALSLHEASAPVADPPKVVHAVTRAASDSEIAQLGPDSSRRITRGWRPARTNPPLRGSPRRVPRALAPSPEPGRCPRCRAEQRKLQALRLAFVALVVTLLTLSAGLASARAMANSFTMQLQYAALTWQSATLAGNYATGHE